ncbi:hypothetical protein K9N08_02070 [Candidatus Gracilibacteria bacterium]|nr:hypothetical protein [Candidatus Gracilibacteria bacterium]MCF7856323.1 hypothetical protein [Candidatus Gracilibacteria bacterium]MCF7896678.1 hypothetical protein [Candidatus Gracilibacteria bacterium]
MPNFKKYISIGALVLVAVTATIMALFVLPEKQPKNLNQDPLADLFSPSQNQLESNFVKSGMVKFSEAWPSEVTSCVASLPDIAFKEKTVFAIFDDETEAAKNYIATHTTKDIVTALGPVFGKATQENSINWTWSNSQKKYTFKAFPGDEENWACYFQTVDFFKDVLKDVTLDYMLLKDVTGLSGKFKTFNDPLQEYTNGETIDIKWKSVGYANAYEIFYGTDKDNLDQTTTSTKSTYSLSGLEANKTYYLGVRAKDKNEKYTSSQNFAEILEIDVAAGTVVKVENEEGTGSAKNLISLLSPDDKATLSDQQSKFTFDYAIGSGYCMLNIQKPGASDFSPIIQNEGKAFFWLSAGLTSPYYVDNGNYKWKVKCYDSKYKLLTTSETRSFTFKENTTNTTNAGSITYLVSTNDLTKIKNIATKWNLGYKPTGDGKFNYKYSVDIIIPKEKVASGEDETIAKEIEDAGGSITAAVPS